MAPYVVAWLVVALAALLLAGLLFRGLRPWGLWRYLVVGLTLAWSLIPYRFDEENVAPAFMVATFRLFFEDGASPRPPLVMLLLVSAGIALAVGLVAGARALWQVGTRRRRRR